MLIALILLSLASLIGSSVLFKHQRVLTYAAVALTLLQGQWLLLTAIDRTVAITIDTSTVFTGGGLLLLAAWALAVRSWLPLVRPWPSSALKDIAIAVPLAIVLAAAVLINSFNGFSDNQWITHGFYNGDTMTLASLVQASLNTNGTVVNNPFAGGGYLEYPTLLHAGIASFVDTLGWSASWLTKLAPLTYIQILATIPLFFLLWDVVSPEPRDTWRRWYGLSSRRLAIMLQAAIVLYVLALSWEGYIYPQGHFFITGLFILQVCLFAVSHPLKRAKQLIPVTVATLITLVLLLSNAVVGTAAVAATVVFYLLRANDKRRRVLERAMYLTGVPVWLALFLFMTPGDSALGWPGFSYTAAVEMLRLAPIIVVLGLGVVWYLTKHTFIGAATVTMIAMAFFTYIFSTRNIVIENASRFFYHGILIGFPLLIYPLVRASSRLRRELLYSSHTLGELMVGWVVTAVVAGFFLLPAGASVASAHDNLMFKDKQIVSAAMLEATQWIRANTSPTAIVLANPDPPWAIPLFTGRALLRANYWLSPNDAVADDVNAAFAGDVAAREQVATQADYLLLIKEERAAWEPLPTEPVFDNNDVAIYQLR